MEGGSSEKGSVGGSNSNSKDPEERLPPGFRFHPTDEELITYYLESKISDANFNGRAITDVDLNKCEPWDLPGKAKMGEKEWYFFSLRDRKYPTGVRTNRATNIGYWKTTGKDKEIFNSVTSQLVGMKKTLVFYRGRAPRGEKTSWVMHEYRIHSKPHFRTSKDEWVVCRVFQKSAGAKKYPSNQSRVLANQYNTEMGPNGGGGGLMHPQMMVAADNYLQFPLARNYLMMSNTEQQLAELSRAYRSNALNLPMNQPQLNMYPSCIGLGGGSSGPAPGSCFTISGLNLNLGTPTAQPILRSMPPSLLNQHDVAPSNIPTSGGLIPEPSSYAAEMSAAHTPSNRYLGVDNCMDLDGYWPSY